MITDYYTQSIVIQRAIKTKVSGRTAETWSTHLTIDGYIDFINGKETTKSNKIVEDGTHVLMTASGQDITNNDRVYYNSEIYRILSVDTVFGHHSEIILEKIGVDN
ncbi:MAG: Phage head-tail joining protein [Bacteroidota bacterium]|jgi:SPP1 family predicted phage head-tail adaptor